MIKTDVSKKDQVEHIVAKTMAEFGKVAVKGTIIA